MNLLIGFGIFVAAFLIALFGLSRALWAGRSSPALRAEEKRIKQTECKFCAKEDPRTVVYCGNEFQRPDGMVWTCTRRPGHRGIHVACSDVHNLYRWTNDTASRISDPDELERA